MMYTQKEKNDRGSNFESEFRASVNILPCWAYKLVNTSAGTPFDYILTFDGGAAAVELKRILHNRLGYSMIRDNQRIGLSQFEAKALTNKSFIVCNVKNENENRCFIIPWNVVRNDICSGRPGSIQVDTFQEIKRIKIDNKRYGWDLSILIRRNQDGRL